MARTSNYSYVIDSTFDPFSFKELVQPLEVYKEAYDAAENQYTALVDKSDAFKSLSETLPEGSKARAIYEGYSNELNKQAKDFAKRGLNMSNRRALTNLKRRYQGEIGRLVKADKDLEEVKALRRQVGLKDSSMLYALDNLDIDQFLDGKTPNLYGISGTELYTRGAAAGKAASSRVYQAGDQGRTLGGYYRKWVERNGYSKESMDAFRANASAIPELQQAVDDILQERGANENLTGINKERARQSVLNGILDGAIYQEKVNPVRDAGVLSASEKDASARGWASYNLQKEKWEREKEEDDIRRSIMYTKNSDGTYSLNPEYVKGNYEVDPSTGKLKKATAATSEDKVTAKKDAALLKLEKKDLASNKGFDVTFGSNRHHYDYIGALSSHNGKWYSGALGEDNPGHTGWGMFSSSNVEDAWGNLSAEGSDSSIMRVLSADELIKVLGKDSNLSEALAERCKAAGVDPENADIQLVEVPNETGSRKGYLIAVH